MDYRAVLFLKSTAGTIATGMTAPVIVPKRIFGANDSIRVAFLGVYGRRRSPIDGFQHLENVEIAALCDPDAVVLAQRAK